MYTLICLLICAFILAYIKSTIEICWQYSINILNKLTQNSYQKIQ